MKHSSDLPPEAAVLGSSPGALTIAAELGLSGVEVTIADFVEASSRLKQVEERGAVECRCDWHGSTDAPVAGVSTDPASAVKGSPLIIVSVPPSEHARMAGAIAPVLEDGQNLLWIGGGGTFTMATALRRLGRNPDIMLGETNSPPFGGPGVGPGFKKLGGTLVAGLPARSGPDVLALAAHIWPWVTGAENVWETILVNFDAIDHVATLLCNLGSAEGRSGRMLLWGEGATPGVANAIETVDAELLSLRVAFGIANRRRYVEYVKDQGFVDELRSTFYETIQASMLVGAPFSCGPHALDSRYVTEDVPYVMVLVSSIGDELGVATPLIDGLIALASAASKQDWRALGRTLEQWGLAGAGADGLRRAAEEGLW